jgi:hypothetical protein
MRPQIKRLRDREDSNLEEQSFIDKNRTAYILIDNKSKKAFWIPEVKRVSEEEMVFIKKNGLDDATIPVGMENAMIKKVKKIISQKSQKSQKSKNN